MNDQKLNESVKANSRFYRKLFSHGDGTATPRIQNICSGFKHIELHLRVMEAALGHKYSPSQPRIPAGQTGGGRWTDGSVGESEVAAPKEPIIRESSKAEFTIYYPDGSTETRSGGSRAWRNNNPGNIRSGRFANTHGAIGDAGGFAVFPDEATGLAASEALLRGPRYSGLTIDEAIARRSPPNENDTRRTQTLIGQFSGLSGTLKINELDTDQLRNLNRAIQRTEGYIPGRVTRSAPTEPKK